MSVRLLVGDVREKLAQVADRSVQLCLTSPPYLALRSYLPADHPDKAREIGSEPTPEAFVATMVEVFRDVRRVLRDDGVLVLNLGDSYNGSGKGPSSANGLSKQHTNVGSLIGATRVNGVAPKNLLMVPFRVAMALQADGWILRSVIPWLKRNAMPESVTDRPASAVEYLFLLSKRPRYHWDADAIRQTLKQPDVVVAQGFGGNKRNGGTTYSGNHYDASQLSGRSYRNSDAFFESWQGLMLDEGGDPLALIVNPQPMKEAHFASFPPRLVEPFVKAATSERGQCPQCGAPWVRQTERVKHGEREKQHRTLAPLKETGNHGTAGFDGNGMRYDTDYRLEVRTTGWQPSCPCDAGEPVPQTVLDPFAGSGTTLMVADRLGRNAVGCELNPEYVALMRRRITNDAPLFADVEVAS